MPAQRVLLFVRRGWQDFGADAVDAAIPVSFAQNLVGGLHLARPSVMQVAPMQVLRPELSFCVSRFAFLTTYPCWRLSSFVGLSRAAARAVAAVAAVAGSLPSKDSG